jgi:hypothetical protein
MVASIPTGRDRIRAGVTSAVPHPLAQASRAAYRQPMVVALQPLLVGALWLILAMTIPCLVLAGVLLAPRLFDMLRERKATRQPEQPQGVPVEKLAADLRRLRAELVYRRPTSNLGLTALMQAYDEVLECTCARLEIPVHLRELPIGLDRDIERLRTEAVVQEAGIPLEVPGHRFGRPAPP